MWRRPSGGCFQIAIRRSIQAEGVSRYIRSTQCRVGRHFQGFINLWVTVMGDFKSQDNLSVHDLVENNELSAGVLFTSTLFDIYCLIKVAEF